ncbi:putative Histidine kinase [Candidatus Sulfobium mesophilum]|uniref:histidine kinase n=1 Tax=Candidatus Sulfobium mesophilum TaxID=2016548 RepID=A0A2U3QER2_9BACT|nr:putative Histidine kinase [Candidatus Sulfobium mesophilum]
MRIIRYFLMLSVMFITWSVLGMVYLDRFVEPFDRLRPLLMPWKVPEPEGATTGERMASMQRQLASSKKTANYAFFGMSGAFAVFCVYLTFVYQQKQRRVRENELLLFKNREIARRNEFIRYISATIGHEFKNNLGRIKRRIDLLPGLTPDVKGRLDENLEKLFADIDIFKKISDEREASLIDFTGVDIRAMLAVLAKENADAADFTFEGGRNLPAITASEPLIKTVFENLIDNSIKYKKPEQPRALITVGWSVDADHQRRYLSFSFRDQGIGMDEIEADRCFYRGKGTGKGWGQGLYFAKYVVGLHAGKIRVGMDNTAQGFGTEIIIKLPFVEEAAHG